MYANHSVSIVGWDDNYSSSNFAHEVYKLADEGKGYGPDNFLVDDDGNPVVDELSTFLTTPPGDGAWLVKNSWGSGTEEFPNRGRGDWGIPVQMMDADGNPMYDEHGDPVMVGSGYFWLSYYDQTFEWPEAFVFDTSLTNDSGIYDQSTLHRNQYDLMPVTEMQARESDELVKSANVFTSEDGEHLMCASYITSTPNTEVTVEVHLLNVGFTSPEDGVLVASNTETRGYAGFYIDFLGNRPVDIQPGQSYSVVVTQRQNTGKYAVDYPTNNGPHSSFVDFGMADSFAVAIQHDESFLYSDGVWASWAIEEVRDRFLRMYDETGIGEASGQKMLDLFADKQYDNFPIKTYAFDRVENIFVRLADETGRLGVCVGNSTTANLEVYGADSEGLTIADYANEPGINLISWSLEGDSEGLVELVPSEDGTQAQVRGLAMGCATVVATVRGVGRVIIPVEVHEHSWTAPTYTWAGDDSSVTATRTCTFDAAHVETETVVPSSTEVGLVATFANPAFETQYKAAEPPATQPPIPAEETNRQASPGTPSSSSGTTSSITSSTRSSTASTKVSSAKTLAKTGDASSPTVILMLLCMGVAGLAVGAALSDTARRT